MPLLVIGEVGAFEGEQRAFLDKVLGAIGYVLEEKVEAIRPRYPEEDAPAAVLTLGHHATDYIVRGAHPFLMLLGKFHVRNDVPVMPVFDPGMMMSSEANRRRTWMDLKSLLKHLDLALPPK